MNPFYNSQRSSGNSNILQQFNAFRQSFTGDPKQKVEELLKSGKMTQDQFNQLYSQASELYKTMHTSNSSNSPGNPFNRLFGM